MNWNSVDVMIVGFQLKEMDVAMIGAWIMGLTLTGGILSNLNQNRDLEIFCNMTKNLTIVNFSEFRLLRLCTDK